jgi:RHS repeat-associated protein
MEYKGRDFTIDADFASGESTAFDSSPKGNYEEWRKGVLPLDMFRGALNQRIVRLRATAKNPTQVLFRNIKIIRAGRPVFEFASLASYGRPQVKTAVQRQLPCVGFDDVPNAPNPTAVNYSVPNGILPKGFAGDFVGPMLPSFPMMMQSTTTSTDANHYKFTGKELDDETGLYNYRARYYSPALGRYMTPDWSARPVPIPYADLSNPQTLNLYTYGKNNPTTLADKDGHCPGDDCKNVTVEVKVLENPKIVQGEKQEDGSVRTGVRARVQDTITVNGKALVHATVNESNTYKATLNGQPKDLGHQEGPSETNNAGQVNDTVGLLAPAGAPKEDAPLVDLLKTGAVTYTNENTITFITPDGQNCQCTATRTVTNVGPDGKASPNYTIDTGHPVVAPVKPPAQQQPKDKEPK